MNLLFVSDRHLGLTATADPAALTYETGLSRTALMAAVMSLSEGGALVCEPSADGAVARLTEAGRRAATDLAEARPPFPRQMPLRELGGRAGEAADPHPGLSGSGSSAQESTDTTAKAGATRLWRAPRVVTIEEVPRPESVNAEPEPSHGSFPRKQSLPSTEDPSPAAEDRATVVNAHKVDELCRLIGSEKVERLRRRLLIQIDNSFGQDAEIKAIAHQAHILISAAGILGFDRLSHHCRRLQAAIEMEDDFSAILADVVENVGQVREFIDRSLSSDA